MAVWLGVGATLTVVALLLALRHVVGQGVEEAALRHKASADHNLAIWRCNTLRGRQARDDCVSRSMLEYRRARSGRPPDDS